MAKAQPSYVNITLSTGSAPAWQSAKSWLDATTRAAILTRFWARVNRADPDGCWPFLGYVAPHGYGQFAFDRYRIRAHRFAWVMSRGEIPEGQDVCHRCDNPRCVNPSHLYLDTHHGNLLDSVRKGRKNCFGRQKLNADQVYLIRARAAQGERHKDIAGDFGIARHTVGQIANRKFWKHLPDVPVAGRPASWLHSVEPTRGVTQGQE